MFDWLWQIIAAVVSLSSGIVLVGKTASGLIGVMFSDRQ